MNFGGIVSVSQAQALMLTVVCLTLTTHVRAGERSQPSQGRYMGHTWRIDASHLIWWDDKPYVRYGFTGNGNVDRFIELGFDQFNACPSEELWASSDDPAKNREAIRQVDEFTGHLVIRGATYYANLNILWPWTGSGRIAPQDRVTCVVKHVGIIPESDRGNRLEVSFVRESRLLLHRDKSQVHLFDMTRGEHTDLSNRLKDIRTIREPSRESSRERRVVNRYTIVLEGVDLPPSDDLRITFLGSVEQESIPGVYPSGLPALWRPGIQQHFRDGLQRFRAAYAKDGLRGLSFGDEINTHRVSLLGSGTYVDFRNDAIALSAYRSWLTERFKTIARLNALLGTRFREFEELTWRLCPYPFVEREHQRENERRHTFGLFDSFEQLQRIDGLQEEFRVWFYGHWLAAYGRMAKEIIGNVPVFVTSAGIAGPAKDYLQIHKQALLEGLDGLSRNHYAWVGHTTDGRPATFVAGTQTRFALETVTELLEAVQNQSGRTKAYWANEFGRPQRGEDAFVDDFGLGHQFSFPSKENLQDFLFVLIDNGYKGFNMFKMNPNVEAAQQEVQWMAQIKDETIRRTISTTSYEKPVSITREEAITLVRNHPGVKLLMERHPGVQSSVSFSEQYGVWIVELTAEGKEIGFASVSPDGRILELDTKN